MIEKMDALGDLIDKLDRISKKRPHQLSHPQARGLDRTRNWRAQATYMPIRLRKLIGAIILIVLVVTWTLLAMALAQSALVKANGVVEIIYYVVAGLGWVLPAMPLIRWMSRLDSA
jgi:hypothetical protein